MPFTMRRRTSSECTLLNSFSRQLPLLVSAAALACGDPGETLSEGQGGSAGASGSTAGTSGGATGSGGGSLGGWSSGASAAGGSSSGGTNAGGVTSSGGVTAGGTTASQGGTPNALGGAAASQGGTTTSSGGMTSGSGGGGNPSCTATGFYVKDGSLYDVKCKEFVLRGVNYPYTWYATRNSAQDLAAIAATGANAVRLVLSSGQRWTKTTANDLTSLINTAKLNKLVSIVEVHDTTGYSEQSGSVALSNATNYWKATDIMAALMGQEAYVILNIANEPNGNNTSTDWAPSHVAAVQALRTAGLNHTLMVDAPNWGQDWQGTMRGGGGASIWNADTKKNLVFSVHMYDVYGTSATVTTYFNTFLMNYEAPLVVGEFAADHGTAGDVDEATIMALSESLGVGYLGWSWAGNSADLATLDIATNFNSASLTTWGNRLINGENGIKATSKPCTCFN